MKVWIVIVMLLSVAASYLAGRATHSGDALSRPSDLATFESALAGSDPLDRAYHYYAFLQALSHDDAGRAAEIIEAQRIWLSDVELRDFFAAWVSFDAPGALEWAMAPHPGRFQRRALGVLMFAWGFQDPPAALDAIKLVPRSSQDMGDELHGQLVAGWVQSEDKSGAADYIARLPASGVRQKGVNALTTELMKQGPEAVIAWVESIPNNARQFKRVAFNSASNAMTAEDPVATARWIEGHLNRPYSSGVPEAIGRRWVEQDPVQAMDWLAGLPAGKARDEAVSTAFRRWSTESRDEAQQWLQLATPREALDPAVRVLVRRDAQSSPLQAVEWAARIENEDRRERVLVGVAQSWYERDPEAAEVWLGTSDLSPEAQAAIRSRSEQESTRKAKAPRRR